ncbi:MAG: hypothetical protein R3217_06845 [Gammaproteobacteria bacterium]|nr:hypothetical protein [Gammaproteobacteria bacterium]
MSRLAELLASWRQADWAPAGKLRLGSLAAIAAWLAWYYSQSFTDWLPILDSVNLAFHEFGHLLFGIFGNTMGWLGGTLGQLLMPLVVLLVFWRQGDTFSVAIAGMWFFQNGLNIARYLGDAQSQILPLVGGGQHDWTYLLTRWGVLQQDTVIASYITVFSWLGLWGMVAWYGYRYLQDN